MTNSAQQILLENLVAPMGTEQSHVHVTLVGQQHNYISDYEEAYKQVTQIKENNGILVLDGDIHPIRLRTQIVRAGGDIVLTENGLYSRHPGVWG